MVVSNHGVNCYQIHAAGRHWPSPRVLSTIVHLLVLLLQPSVENSLPPFTINQFFANKRKKDAVIQKLQLLYGVLFSK